MPWHDGIATHDEPAWRKQANFVMHARVGDGKWEQLWARKLDGGRFMICCIPFFGYDLALGDEVDVYTEGDKRYVLRDVVAPSSHYTFRVWFGQTGDPGIRDTVVAQARAAGNEFEWFTDNLLALDAADETAAQKLANFLHEHQLNKRLIYETGLRTPRTIVAGTARPAADAAQEALSAGAQGLTQTNEASRATSGRASRVTTDQMAFIQGRLATHLTKQPEFSTLVDRLLALGGVAVVPPPRLESDLDPLLERGQLFSQEARLEPGAPSRCHQNVACVQMSDPRRYRICTGYALSDDGLWRQHSWLLDAADTTAIRLVETTVPRVRYYGVELGEAEARAFVAANAS